MSQLTEKNNSLNTYKIDEDDLEIEEENETTYNMDMIKPKKTDRRYIFELGIFWLTLILLNILDFLLFGGIFIAGVISISDAESIVFFIIDLMYLVLILLTIFEIYGIWKKSGTVLIAVCF